MSVDVLREALRRVEAGEPVALATVIATRGSTPQKVGARALVEPGGRRVAGTLGGGAVEAAAIEAAAATLRGAAPAVREYDLSTGTDDWGLACGGTMVLFTEALGPEAAGWLRSATAALEGGEPLAVVAAIGGGSAGTRLVIRQRAVEGRLGDAALEDEGIALGRRVLAREGTELLTAGAGAFYAEVFGPAPTLVVAGAGHVGRALAGLGRFLGVRVVVLDDRAEYATRERFPQADEVRSGPVPEVLGELGLHARAAVVVAMRDQDLDYAATAAALRTPAGYVGLVGARRKAVLITERLLAEGVPAARVRELRCPIGLDIGARTPEEIALAILGEWIMLRQGGSGAPLRLGDDLFAKAAGRAAASGPAR